MDERDPLRSGAIFRVQSQDYVALRSPVPRLTPGVPSVARPIPSQGSTFGQTAMHPPPTEAGIMFQPSPGVARGTFAGRTQQLGAPRVHEDVFGTSGELRRGAKSPPTLVVSRPAEGLRNAVRVPRFEVGGLTDATIDSCVRASGAPYTMGTTDQIALETARERGVPDSAHHQEEIGGAASGAAVNIRVDPSKMCESVAMRIDSTTNKSGSTTIGSNVGGCPSPENTTLDVCGESAESKAVRQDQHQPKQRQRLKPNPKRVSNTLEPDQLRRPQREVMGWQPIAGRALRAKRGSQTEKADTYSLTPRGEAPALKTKASGAGEEYLAPCSGVRVSEGTGMRKRRRVSAATLEAAHVRQADDARDLVARPASSRHSLAPRTELEVTTTRSGRRSTPLLSFWQAADREGNKTKVAQTAPQRDVKVSDKRARTTHVGAKQSPNLSSAKPAARGTSTPRKRRKNTAAAAEVGVADGIPDRAITEVGKREASAGLVKTTRSGRRSAPVLDWWRSQRLSHAPDGNVVVASGPSQDELFGERLTTTPKVVRPKSSGAKVRSPRCKTVKPDRDGTPVTSGKDTSWTQSQLSSLRVAQMGTAPRAKDFWGAVASIVEGRNPQECQKKWFEHFGSPRARNRKNGKKSTRAQKTSTPVSMKTSIFSEDDLKAEGFSAAEAKQPPKQDDADDLFQATPMRVRFGAARRNFGGEAPPKTPAGPVAVVDEDASTVKRSPRKGHSVYKPVSATYVQAMSKKMRKACGASKSGSSSTVMQEKVSNSRQSRSRPAGRRVHAVTTSRGRSLKASVSRSGAVDITSTGRSDDEDDEDDELGVSDDSDSED